MIDQWQDRGLSDSLSSFDNFNRLLGLENLQQYLFSRAVQKLPNWSAHPLDDQGKALQTEMQSALDVSLHQTFPKMLFAEQFSIGSASPSH